MALAEIPGSLGAAPSPPVFVPGPINDRLWHLPFNRLEKINEQLVEGREDIFFGWEFDAAAQKLPDDVTSYYVGMLSNPDSLRACFGFYRALDTTLAQDGERKTRRLTLPVLAIGGAMSFGDHVGEALQLVADDVQSVVVPDTGHFVAEEAPDEMLAALTPFLAPDRDGSAEAHTPGPGSHVRPVRSRSFSWRSATAPACTCIPASSRRPRRSSRRPMRSRRQPATPPSATPRCCSLRGVAWKPRRWS